MKFRAILFTVFLILVNTIHAGEPSISHLTLLLPYSSTLSHTPKFRLEAFGGCFHWTTTNPQITVLESTTPNYKKGTCESSIFVSAGWNIGQTTERRSAWVCAEDSSTGLRLECEVFVDRVSRLEILTSTRVVNVGDTESLNVQAYDVHQNVFSTLEGLPFRWTNTAPHILRPLSFIEAGVNVSTRRQLLESEGYQTDSLPVQGLSTGQASVTVQLLDEWHDHDVPPESVSFSVVEPLSVTPSLVRLPPQGEIQLELLTRFRDARVALDKSRKWRIVDMPSSQYKWSSLDTSIAHVDSDYGLVVALLIGTTQAIVIDSNLPHHQQSCQIDVVMPKSIQLTLIPIEDTNARYLAGPGPTWYPIVNNKYLLNISLADSMGKLLYSTPTVHFKITIEGNAVLLSDNSIHSYLLSANYLEACDIIVEISSIKSRFCKDDGLDTHISPVRQHIQVVSPINIIPRDSLILPITCPTLQKLHLSATGGSGRYEWKSDGKYLNVDMEEGWIESKIIGSTNISCIDHYNSENKALNEVIIASPSTLQFAPSKRQVAIGEEIMLIVTTNARIPSGLYKHYSICDNLLLTANPSDDGLELSRIGNCFGMCPHDQTLSCWEIFVRGVKNGISKMSASLSTCPGVISKIKPVFTKIAVYPPLDITPMYLLTAVSSTNCFHMIGGPLNWPEGSHSTQLIDTENKDLIVVMKKHRPSNVSIGQVTCSRPHSQKIKLLVTVSSPDSNYLDVTTTINISVVCYPRIIIEPREVHLSVNSQIDIGVREHPLLNNLTFTIDDPNVAYVTPNGVLSGKSLGITKLHTALVHESAVCNLESEIDSFDSGLHDSIMVHIAFQEFKITGLPTSIVRGSLIQAHIIGSHSEAPEDSAFQSVFCEWRTNSHNLILSPLLPSSTDSSNNETVIGFAVSIYASRSGVAVLTAHISVQNPTPTIFQVQNEVSIITPLQLISPLTLILSPNSRSQILTTKTEEKVFYSVHTTSKNNDSQIHVTDNGLILAGSVPNIAIIQLVTSQSLVTSISVVVTPPKSLSVVSVTDEKTDLLSYNVPYSHFFHFCENEIQKFAVIVHDSLGRQFNSVEGCFYEDDFRILSSPNDLLSIDYNGFLDGPILVKLNVKAIKIGIGVLKVFLHNSTLIPSRIRVEVLSRDSSFCRESDLTLVARVRLRFLSALRLITGDERHSSFESDLIADIARSLSVPIKRILIVQVLSEENIVEFDILPPVSSDGDTRASMALSEILTKQLRDSSSLLRQGLVTSGVDPITKPQISRLPFTNYKPKPTIWILSNTRSPDSSIPFSSSLRDESIYSHHTEGFSTTSLAVIVVLVSIVLWLIFNRKKQNIDMKHQTLTPVGPGIFSPYVDRTRFYDSTQTTGPSSSVNFR